MDHIPDDRAIPDAPEPNYTCSRCDRVDENGDGCIECDEWLCSNCYGDTWDEKLCPACSEYGAKVSAGIFDLGAAMMRIQASPSGYFPAQIGRAHV